MPEFASAMSGAADAFRAVVPGVPAGRLAAPTPCAQYDLRGLLNHLLYWAPRLSAAARGLPAPPADGGEEVADLVTGDWPDRLTGFADELADALGDPAAWRGMTQMSTPLPASMVGSMVLCELVVHGWDLAVATGQPFRCRPDVAEAALAAVGGMAEQGREYGVFGEPVEVAPDASALERTLGLAGRDPGWRP
ncbi:TIGR03086 family metal-binding protein [Amycolatopsis aidingensis]|uniref:TIGR03086 family metal-binding protein n=1 Tax=Amycolatopsis aidingensis TaxID=2842453 RepID=UPI001C0E2919|nr:TIGR03086 family metal-binding protein [Amycolatopsis aidingensis]